MSLDTQTARNAMNLPSKWVMGLVIALILGAGFRLAWSNDIEYKLDEAYTFTKTRNFLQGGGGTSSEAGISRWLGMPTSKGFKNPGMSLWVFYAIGSVSGASTPPALARGVQACNVAATLLLLGFAWRCFKDREREWWFWAVAMVCVNPFAVLFERKIWPPCTLPLIIVIFLMCWRSRSTRWGAFGWGSVGILAGQIHMAGFFYAAAFFLWTVIYDRRRAAWGWWLAGNLAGVIPMLPWICYIITPGDAGEQGNAAFIGWWRLFTNHFWVDWVTEPFAFGLQYFLGGNFYDFARRPLLGGHATYGVWLLLGLAILAGLGVLVSGFLRWWNNRSHWLAIWKSDRAMFTPSVLQAGFWFFGILLTVSCIRFERHYLIVTFPLMFLWVARLALPIDATQRQWSAGRRLLLALCVANALVTFMLLEFIHVNGGVPDGDYRETYAKQLQDGSPLIPQ